MAGKVLTEVPEMLTHPMNEKEEDDHREDDQAEDDVAADADDYLAIIYEVVDGDHGEEIGRVHADYGVDEGFLDHLGLLAPFDDDDDDSNDDDDDGDDFFGIAGDRDEGVDFRYDGDDDDDDEDDGEFYGDYYYEDFFEFDFDESINNFEEDSEDSNDIDYYLNYYRDDDDIFDDVDDYDY
ncbi:hypothetical protein HELRODRAFT_182862 [Helobdella robusta]|uniref:Uncharacterized protein n=1 Tax=Helobdella robusta TaxID=6412 RepID=T1FIW0_HELRO|nr:hypothetical protein HELRODRAFT_182862 [Helobdella robusta]ESN90070.1 hypothetical protein HELRODRAFT_182862 [Helobdella robusta]